MDVGDKIRIVEDIPHNKFIKKRVTIGEIQQITKFNIIIKKIHNGELTRTTSFNIATFKDKRFHFYLEVNKEWKPIRVKITEHSSTKLGGGKYA
jgi:hypothetical protein